MQTSQALTNGLSMGKTVWHNNLYNEIRFINKKARCIGICNKMDESQNNFM
jgi:hypothetical protein